MTPYAQELRCCQVVLLLRAVIEARGNICAAAGAIGVHRNTIWRALNGAGYDSPRLKRLAAAHGYPYQREPPASVDPGAEQRRVA